MLAYWYWLQLLSEGQEGVGWSKILELGNLFSSLELPLRSVQRYDGAKRKQLQRLVRFCFLL